MTPLWALGNQQSRWSYSDAEALRALGHGRGGRGGTRRGGASVTLEPGLHGEREFEVDDRLVTDVGGRLATPVLSTPGMIGMMERTAAMLVYPHLPDGRPTVGFELCVTHVGSAKRGARCTARATLREVVDGRKLFFDVDVVDGERVIGVGTHQRRIIEVSGA